MTHDPNNKKWSEGDRYGANLMKKQGWDGEKGLGKNEDGLNSHVRVTKKDNTLGIGYDGAVAKNQVWSLQAANFADILKRHNQKDSDDESGSGSDAEQDAPTSSGAVVVGKAGSLYTKRRALKTGVLNSSEGKSEILGSKRERPAPPSDSSSEDSDSDSDNEFKKPKKNKMNLKSKMLQRLMLRNEAHEPRANVDDEGARIIVAKPTVKPPKCTATPFMA